MSSLRSNQPEHDDLPDALIGDLRAAYSRNMPSVPPALDDAILREARAGFARRRRFQLALRGAIGVAAAAAAIAVAFPLFRADRSPTPQASRDRVPTHVLSVMPQSEDVDGSGKVDILDAFVVAKLIEVRTEIDEAYDVNGDGKVDQADVDRIALAAVDTLNADGRNVQ